MEKSNSIRQMIGTDKHKKSSPFFDEEILRFQKSKNLILPDDAKEYFRELGTKNGQYNENLYRFFSLKEFKPVNEALINFDGVPDYSNLINTFPEHQRYFVFADYMFHLFSYAIKLSDNYIEKNEIYVICGDKFRLIADSLSEFVGLYLARSNKLQFED